MHEILTYLGHIAMSLLIGSVLAILASSPAFFILWADSRSKRRRVDTIRPERDKRDSDTDDGGAA